MNSLDLVSLIVPDYDEAIRFFVDVLQFTLAEDRASQTTTGQPKRWVVVRPPHGGTGFVLARADTEAQQATVGAQWAGRVGLFLRVSNFTETHRRLADAGIVFEGEARAEPYGHVIVFRDPFGNRWDLLGDP
jgi:catechol 2,3-dioxygenase-like lactoylglutathione lyase family enzyme